MLRQLGFLRRRALVVLSDIDAEQVRLGTGIINKLSDAAQAVPGDLLDDTLS